jgi:glucosamine-6-phosphate deaminase
MRNAKMKLQILDTKEKAARLAARKAAGILREAIASKGRASFIAATGKSQLEFLENLVNDSSIDWSKTRMFHLDEYIGLPATHPASFRRYLKERFIDKVNPGAIQLINGDSENPEEECERLNQLIVGKTIDVAFVGIGENGHLGFNDPGADFETETPFIIVNLDEACRRQQLGEGWFSDLPDVPERAITMSIRQIMKSRHIVCTVPGKRKAQAVKNCLEKEISAEYPASILRRHPNAFIFLDKNSASLLGK